MVPVPMTSARGMGPLPAMLGDSEGPGAVRRIFAAEGVPLALIGDRTHCLPLASLAGLFERAAQAMGNPLFGLDAGFAMTPADYGLWVRYAQQADTLGGAIARVVRTLPIHQSGTQMCIARRPGGQVAWQYRHPGITLRTYRHHSDHIVPGMIGFLRGFLGRDWLPTRIEAGYPPPEVAARVEAATATPWIFDCPALAIVFPASALAARRSPDTAERLPRPGDQAAEATRDQAGTTAGQIAAVVSLRLLDGSSDIEGAARTLRLGRRTLQRQLAEQGLTYRALVNRCRLDRARGLVCETGSPLKQIASELGYSDPAHFTRAFTRHFGVPPSRLRDGGDGD
jgi:AraC-like DNA-binding protein